MRKLTASDRSSLIRLAASLPVGDENRRAILSGLRDRSKKAGAPLVTIGRYNYDAEQIQEMLDEKGNVKYMYVNAENLPRWIQELGANKRYKEYETGPAAWIPNPNGKKFPGGGWKYGSPAAWRRVAQILSDILKEGKHVTIRPDGIH